MPAESDPTLGTIFYLVVIFAIIPIVLFVLSRAASPGFQPEPFQVEEIRRLARSLEQSVAKSLEDATHAFASASGERRALDDLIQLAERTESFRARMQQLEGNQGVRVREFYLLQNAFRRARRGFPKLTTYARHPERLQGLIRTMESLRFYFDSAPAPAEETQAERPGHARETIAEEPAVESTAASATPPA